MIGQTDFIYTTVELPHIYWQTDTQHEGGGKVSH